MFSTTKIRATIAVLATAFAVAVGTGPIVPAAHALDNVTPESPSCTAGWNQFAGYVRLALEADRAGRTADRDYYLSQARELKDAAKRDGCAWAQPHRAAIVDRLSRGPVGGGLPIVQTGDSPTTGSTAVSPRDSTVVKVGPRTGGGN